MFEEVIIYSPLWIPGLAAIVFAVIYFSPYLVTQYSSLFIEVFTLVIYTASVWVPIVLIIALWGTWKTYVRASYLANLKWVLLEIKVPQEIFKSPLAMETFLMSLHQGGRETTFIDRWWNGQVRANFSLEMISVEGKVKFIIYTQDSFRKFVETGLYAQYPDIEIHEIPDYTRSTHYDPKEMSLYCIDFKLAKPHSLPIKTYVDYDLDNKQAEEQTKIDPINHLIEYLGSIGPNQQVWFQMIIRAHKKEQKIPGKLFGKTDAWKDSAKEEIEKIRASAIPKGSKETTKFPNPTKGEQERILAIERNISKLSFDVGIRAAYFGKNEFFDGRNISGLRAMLKSYSAMHMNEFKPSSWLNDFDYPWQDFREIRKNKKKNSFIEAYKRRSFFYGPTLGETETYSVLNVEELASVFHPPGQVTKTPNLDRIPSKKAGAPSNLPI